MKKIKWELWEDEPEIDLKLEDSDSDDVYNEEDDVVELMGYEDMQIPQVNTPLGVFTPYDNMRPNKMFEYCWIGHTNFDICASDVLKLNKVVGVEALRIMSRYRFFIGIGKSFGFASVRNDIQEVLCKREDDKPDVFGGGEHHIKLKMKKSHPKINESP
jgi:hypothetical protein